jgi:hypothetical protein
MSSPRINVESVYDGEVGWLGLPYYVSDYPNHTNRILFLILISRVYYAKFARNIATLMDPNYYEILKESGARVSTRVRHDDSKRRREKPITCIGERDMW